MNLSYMFLRTMLSHGVFFYLGLQFLCSLYVLFRLNVLYSISTLPFAHVLNISSVILSSIQCTVYGIVDF